MLKLTAAEIALLPQRSQYTGPAPVLPADLAPIADYTNEQQRDMAVDALKRLRTYVTKAAKWQIACARHSAGLADAPDVRKMPSRSTAKASYDKSAHLAAWLGWDRAGTRCHALIDQVQLVLAAQEILGA